MTDELRLDERVAVVTGAGRGIGRAHALLLAARDARVVVNDLGTELDGQGASSAPADSVVEEIIAAGGHAVASHADISDADGARLAFLFSGFIVNMRTTSTLSSVSPLSPSIRMRRTIRISFEEYLCRA